MQILEPDFWKCRGRYSKQACRRGDTDVRPISAEELMPAGKDLAEDA